MRVFATSRFEQILPILVVFKTKNWRRGGRVLTPRIRERVIRPDSAMELCWLLPRSHTEVSWYHRSRNAFLKTHPPEECLEDVLSIRLFAVDHLVKVRGRAAYGLHYGVTAYISPHPLVAADSLDKTSFHWYECSLSINPNRCVSQSSDCWIVVSFPNIVCMGMRWRRRGPLWTPRP